MAKTVAKIKIKFDATHNFDELRKDIKKIQNESFGDVVFAGIRAIAVAQRREAPSRTSDDIARSIKTSSVNKTKDGWTAISYSNLKKAVFTNEGTGTRIGGEEYEIKWKTKRGQEVVIRHPGIYRQQWFERGANKGSPLALKAFKQKVDRLMGSLG